MRRFLNLSMLLLCGIGAFAQNQDVNDFIADGVVWTYHEHLLALQMDDGLYKTYHIEFKGNIVIGGKTYKKAFRYFDDGLKMTDKEPFGYVRQEGKCLYGIRNDGYVPEPYEDYLYMTNFFYGAENVSGDNEILLYDFNAPWRSYSENHVKTGDYKNRENSWVSSSEIIDGDEYVAWSLKSSSLEASNVYIVENIGSLHEGDICTPEPCVFASRANMKIGVWCSTHLIGIEDKDGRVLYSAGADEDDGTEVHPVFHDGMKWIYFMQDGEQNPSFYTYEINGNYISHRIEADYESHPERDYKAYKKVFRYGSEELPDYDSEPYALLYERPRGYATKTGIVFNCFSPEECSALDWSRQVDESTIDVNGTACSVWTDKDGRKIVENIGPDYVGGDLLSLDGAKNAGLAAVLDPEGNIIYKGVNYGKWAGIETVTGDTAKTVAGVRYFNLLGVESAEPFQGVNVVVTTYTDGSRQSRKVIR